MWRPWEGNEVESNVNVRVPSTSRNKTITGSKCMGTLNKQSQKIICNVYAYVKSNKLDEGPITETEKAVGLSRQAISRVVERGPKTPKKCKNEKQEFEKVDNFTCDLIRRTVYDFFKNGQSPTVTRNIGDSKADSHDEMNSEIFEDWFTNKLMKNLPTSPPCIIVKDNAAYHSRLQFRLPNRSTRKDDIISFMVQHNLEVPNPLPTISVLLELIKEANISREFVIDKIARDFGHEVLWLSPYHCNLNATELIWMRLKHEVRKRNVTPSRSDSVCRTIRECVELINSELWTKCVNRTREIERQYIVRDSENDRDLFIISVGDNDSEGSSSDES
ncbi:hypothetical protein ANN_15764 [Periplaneta americana]|uniref:Tc1-like transposase DDE domain-containing protein n=1 Tax=Periplaneta americana TaxID=6978 RepID=A0ABQ8SID6_PERAM|nr:hypothetical protein ANN_15764 [Periplaneta americana]